MWLGNAKIVFYFLQKLKKTHEIRCL